MTAKYTVNISFNTNFEGGMWAESEEEAREKVEKRLLKYFKDAKEIGFVRNYTETPHYEVTMLKKEI